MSPCVKAEPPGSPYSKRTSLHRYCSYTSVISRPSFNCGSFMFGIHLFSFSSSPVSVRPPSTAFFCSLVLSISSFLIMQHIFLCCLSKSTQLGQTFQMCSFALCLYAYYCGLPDTRKLFEDIGFRKTFFNRTDIVKCCLNIFFYLEARGVVDAIKQYKPSKQRPGQVLS